MDQKGMTLSTYFYKHFHKKAELGPEQVPAGWWARGLFDAVGTTGRQETGPEFLNQTFLSHAFSNTNKCINTQSWNVQSFMFYVFSVSLCLLFMLNSASGNCALPSARHFIT